MKVNSSNLSDVDYDPSSSILTVAFTNGATWVYSNVPQSAYDGMMNAASIGSYFASNIKGRYPENKVM